MGDPAGCGHPSGAARRSGPTWRQFLHGQAAGRPHLGIAQRVPDDQRDAPRATVTDVETQQIRRKPVLGGLINEYRHAA